MKPLDERNLDTAIFLGSAVCKELGICCDERGRVIFQIYQKLEDLKSEKSATPDATGTTTVTGIVTGTVTPAVIGTGTAADNVDSDQTGTEKPEN